MMKNLLLIISTVFFFFGCSEEQGSDSDFPSVQIGEQIWMTENLSVTTFKNGDPIQEAKSHDAWLNAFETQTPAWCYYNNDPINADAFGKLYNYWAVKDPRGLAPEGWHVPSDSEWDQLIESCGGKEIAGLKLKSKELWSNGGGTDEYGFAAVPGGGRREHLELNLKSEHKGIVRLEDVVFDEPTKSTEFFSKDEVGFYWTSTDLSEEALFIVDFLSSGNSIFVVFGMKDNGFSVRCIKD